MNRFLTILLAALISVSSHAAEPEKDPVRIGALFPLSGWAAMGGKTEFGAVQLAVEEINRSGGISGRKVELVLEDNRSLFKDTATAFAKLERSIRSLISLVRAGRNLQQSPLLLLTNTRL